MEMPHFEIIIRQLKSINGKLLCSYCVKCETQTVPMVFLHLAKLSSTFCFFFPPLQDLMISGYFCMFSNFRHFISLELALLCSQNFVLLTLGRALNFFEAQFLYSSHIRIHDVLLRFE